MARDNDAADGLMWFILGAAVGASVALLYAPKSGKETRKYLGKRTEEGREFLTDTGEEMYERGKELFDKGREIADEAAEIFERGRKLARG